MNLAEALDFHAKARPRHPAIIAGDRIIPHADFAAMVRDAASRLSGLGLRSGDLAAVCLKDTPEHLALIYALARRGVVMLPMDVRWTSAEKGRLIEHFRVDILFGEPGAERIPNVRSALFDELLNAEKDDEAVVDGTDLPLLLSLSSGTTGRPKGPRITHQHMLRRFWTHWINLGLSSADRYVSATPLYFGGGRSFAMSTLFSGGSVVLFPPPFDAPSLCDEIARVEATAIFLVPTQLRQLLDLGSERTAAFRELNLLMSSGAPLDAAERQRIREELCANFVEYYGSTEGGGISYSTPETQRDHPDSVGRPVFAVQIEVVDENHRPLPAAAVGRLRYRGPGVADGYFGETNDEDAFRDGWFYPGDLAEISADGFIFLRGRVKDVIIRGGVNIYPAEIETVLRAHPDVADAAVVGRPSVSLGEDVVAFVKLRQSADSTSLVLWCRSQLAPYKTPSDFVVVPDLPRNSAGKILKAELVSRLVTS